jgi:hypothetical protein
MWRYHRTVDLLFDLFGLVCLANKNENSTVMLPPLVFPELSVFNQWIDVYL